MLADAEEINYLIQRPGTLTSVVAETMPHLKKGAIRDFKNIMEDWRMWIPGRWNASDKIYTFLNGSKIEFFSADNKDKMRGPRRDRLIINEANRIDFESYTQLAVRTNGKVLMDWNPVNRFWFHNELQGDPDTDFLILTWKDNEACPVKAKRFIQKAKKKAEAGNAYWKNWYLVYGLGQIGRLEGVVFQNWSITDEIPETAKLLCYGCDFGFTNDPTTIVSMWRWKDKIIFHEHLYRTGMLTNQIADFWLSLEKKRITYADNSDPRLIRELQNAGVNVKGTNKKKINFGIDLLQQKDMLITRSSTNMINELENYTWAENKDGKFLTDKTIDDYNHTIDAMRYCAVETFKDTGWAKARVRK